MMMPSTIFSPMARIAQFVHGNTYNACHVLTVTRIRFYSLIELYTVIS
jgi:hypothetical protein